MKNGFNNTLLIGLLTLLLSLSACVMSTFAKTCPMDLVQSKEGEQSARVKFHECIETIRDKKNLKSSCNTDVVKVTLKVTLMKGVTKDIG